MARYWVMGMVGSGVVHVAIAAAFLTHSASEPISAEASAPESGAILVELVRPSNTQRSDGALAYRTSEEKPRPAAEENSATHTGPAFVASTNASKSGGVIPAAEATAPNANPMAISDYLQRLESHLSRHHRYPGMPNGVRPEGVVRVAMIIGRDGTLLDAWIETSSGVAALDDAALATVRRAAPMPGVPGSLPGTIDLIVPLRFTRDGGVT